MEIGSFIELQFPSGREYFRGKKDIARLNSGRTAIYHAFRVTGCNAIWLPYYQCDTVREFLLRKGINLRYYHIDSDFNPIDLQPASDEAVLLVNYFGIMSWDQMDRLARLYTNTIIDNSQAFFCPPLDSSLNVYSARKFIGVPDGSYVFGKNAGKYENEYAQGYSSDTSLFLLQRIEYGCQGKSYHSRMANEQRINHEDVMKMSALTFRILDGTDYSLIQKKRRENFAIASKLFEQINLIDPLKYYDDTCVPMVYPLVVENDDLLVKLLEQNHFQGHWWSYLLNEMPEDSFEYWMSRYVIPITIDQRYGKNDIKFIRAIL